MRVRSLKASDIPILKAMAEASGYPYPDPCGLEAIQVVVDEGDRPLMAVGAERILQLYLWSGRFDRPLAKLHCLRLIHETMAIELRNLGYHSSEVFLPPAIADKFGARLERTFGWIKNWQSWNKRF
jgi:hypothetical protein